MRQPTLSPKLLSKTSNIFELLLIPGRALVWPFEMFTVTSNSPRTCSSTPIVGCRTTNERHCVPDDDHVIAESRTRLRVHRAPGIPRALFSERRRFQTNSRAPRARGASASDKHVWNCVHELMNSRAIRSPVIVRECGRSSTCGVDDEWRGRGVLDAPLEAGHDGGVWGGASVIAGSARRAPSVRNR